MFPPRPISCILIGSLHRPYPLHGPCVPSTAHILCFLHSPHPRYPHLFPPQPISSFPSTPHALIPTTPHAPYPLHATHHILYPLHAAYARSASRLITYNLSTPRTRHAHHASPALRPGDAKGFNPHWGFATRYTPPPPRLFTSAASRTLHPPSPLPTPLHSGLSPPRRASSRSTRSLGRGCNGGATGGDVDLPTGGRGSNLPPWLCTSQQSRRT